MRMDDVARRNPAVVAEVGLLRPVIEKRLADLFPDDPDADLVEAAMREAVCSPGKRLRTLMTVLAARDLGWDGPASLDAGCAIELVHAASLILDDLPCMDDADMRRGRPAVHVRFGEDVAVLAAIALLTRAYGLVAGAPGLRGDQRAAMVSVLSDAVGTKGLVGGQLADLRGGDGAASPGKAAAVNERKTAALFVAALEMACILGGGSHDCRGRFRTFGRELGQAFQILDDLLDVVGDPALVGKPTGQDAGKPTLIHLLGEEAGWIRLRHHVSAAVTALSGLPNGAERLAGLMDVIFSGRPHDHRPALSAVSGSRVAAN